MLNSNVNICIGGNFSYNDALRKVDTVNAGVLFVVKTPERRIAAGAAKIYVLLCK